MGSSNGPESQDRYFCRELEECVIAGVFDGHGTFGGTAASTACNYFDKILVTCAKTLRELSSEKLTSLMNSWFDEAHGLIQAEILHKSGGHLTAQGTLCATSGNNIDGGCSATILISFEDGMVICAHVGDSEAVLFPHASPRFQLLTSDHSPGNAAEYLRMSSLPEPRAVCVYDRRSVRPKRHCPPVFTADGTLIACL